MASKGKGKAVAGKSLAPDVGASTSSGKRRKAIVGNTSAAERRKRRRSVGLQFFDDAAFEASSESEEDGDDEDIDLEPEMPDRDIGKPHGEASKKVGKSHLLPFLVKEEELDHDEFEELIKERYGHGSEFVTFSEDNKEFDSKVGTDPTMDAIIWRVKCMVGRERQVAFCFMQKYVDLGNLGTNLQIQSVFALEHMKGHVFIEAEKQSDVIEACRGFCSVYPSGIKLVPSSEVPLLLASRNKPLEVPLGSWARMRSGNYKGDLAQVIAVDDGRKTVTVKLVPRVDLQAIANKFGGGISLKTASVPAPRLISSYELEKFRSHIEVRRDKMTGEYYEILDGMMLKDGYLFKRVSSTSLIYSGIQPSADEVLKFSESPKAEDEDLNWISSVYRGNKQPRFAETSDTTSKKGSFNLHELVFFRRKDFGVIIAEEKDYFKILKGDVEGTEVVPVKMQDIKKSCIDKMFTALDRHRKSISINDTVQVLEGPLKGREGLVKHLYKGSLFVRDDNVSENGGFFCVKSNSCGKAIKSKQTFGENVENDQNPLFSESAMAPDDQQDGAQGSSWGRQNYGDQSFHVGQTLRIRKGPLKGYLCRVVGIYRSDITVKLDSLVKIITVQDKFLSDPSEKRGLSTFSSDEKPFTGGFSFGETENQAEKSALDDGGPSLDRDSWQPFATSNVDANKDNQTDQGREDDPWGSKSTPVARADAGSSGAVVAGWGDSASTADRGCEADPWGSKLASATRSDAGVSDEAKDSWTGTISTSGPEDDLWGSKISSKEANAGISTKATDGWGKQTIQKANVDRAETSRIAADCWSTKLSLNHDNDANHWDKSTIPDGGGSWDANLISGTSKDPSESKIAQWNTPASDVQWGSANVKNSNGTCGWDVNLRKETSNDPSESRIAQSAKNSDDSSCWGKTISNTDKEGASWNDKEKTIVSGKEDGWGRPAGNNESKSSSWNKGTHASAQSDGWSKGGSKGDAESSGWNKGDAIPSQNDEWAKTKSSYGTHDSGSDKGKKTVPEEEDAWGRAAVNIESKTISWDKGKDFSSQSDGWKKGGWKGESESGDRNKASIAAPVQSDEWAAKSSHENRDSGWNKGRQPIGDQDSWSKPRNIESSGGEGHGFGWGKQNEQNFENGGRDQESNWGQHRSDGDRGGRRGRGRGGRFGRGGRGQEDNSSGPRNQEGNWVSGRGARGRGRGTWCKSWESNEESQSVAVRSNSGRGCSPYTVGTSDKGTDGSSKFAASDAPSNKDEIGRDKSDGWSSWAIGEPNKEKGASWVQIGASAHPGDEESCPWDDKGKKKVNTLEGSLENIESKSTSWDNEKGDITQRDGWSSAKGTVHSNKDKEQDAGWDERGASMPLNDDKSCSMDDKEKKMVMEEDAWNKSFAVVGSQPSNWDAKGGESGDTQSGGWIKNGATAMSNKSKEQGAGWDQIGVSALPKADESILGDDKAKKAVTTVEDTWSRPQSIIESQPSIWDTKKGGTAHSDEWGNICGTVGSNKDEGQGAGWNDKDKKQVNTSEDPWSTPVANVDSPSNKWETRKVGSSLSEGWGKAGSKGEAEDGWSKGRFTLNQSEQSEGNYRTGNFEGSGGRGRGRGRGFGWGNQGNNDDEGRAKGSTWGQHEDGGGRGGYFGRGGRGRGGYFGRGGRGQEDSQSGPRQQGGSWASQGGRGRAWGQNGEAAESGCRQGSSRNQSSDWKNQEGHEDFAGPSGGSQSSTWNNRQENNQQKPNDANASKSGWNKW